MQPFRQAERSIAKKKKKKKKKGCDLYMSQNKACNVKSRGKSKVLVIEVYLDIPC